eukprot:TRINITY_DN13165_c0_g1_i1.p2 TRINITY_DN13165_c0_g1~~TRINITY_DN13165_c0_g1_i1.p2  ORF type:complete len:158 (+),score=70.20 TRINITY_DN13165_c0_g1_i1:34-474(+)
MFQGARRAASAFSQAGLGAKSFKQGAAASRAFGSSHGTTGSKLSMGTGSPLMSSSLFTKSSSTSRVQIALGLSANEFKSFQSFSTAGFASMKAAPAPPPTNVAETRNRNNNSEGEKTGTINFSVGVGSAASGLELLISEDDDEGIR